MENNKINSNFKPFGYCKYLPSLLDESKIEILGNKIANQLQSLNADVVKDDTRNLKFYAGPLRIVTGMNMLIAIGVGTIQLINEKGQITIRYDLSFQALLVIAFMLISVPAFFIIKAPNLTIVESMGLVLGLYALLTIPNILLALIRFNFMLKKIVKSCTQ